MSETFLSISKGNRFFKKKISGISLLETLLVISIAAVAMTQVITKFGKKKNPIVETLKIINETFEKAYIRALLTNKICQVRFFFDDDKHLISIGFGAEGENASLEKNNSIANSAMVKKLIINGNDEMSVGKTKETWVLLYPEGYAQMVEIHLHGDEENLYGIYDLNPFSCTFKEKQNEDKDGN